MIVALATLAGFGAVLFAVRDELRVTGPVGADDGDAADTVEAEPGILPLLGTSGTVPQQPALAVKIDNTERGRPPSGLLDADLVYEEVVEGGLTRLLAVYHSQGPETVGPVRSARSTDLQILADLGRPLFAWSGANPTFRAAVDAADLVDVGVDAAGDGYRRDPDRPAPYNLYAAPAELRDAADGSGSDAGEPPPPQFSYRTSGSPLTGEGVVAVSSYTVDAAQLVELATSIRWSWDAAAGLWMRTQDGTPHVDDAGTPVSAVNVVVRSTRYRDSGIRDSVGAVVPEAVMVGEGDALLLSDGQAQPGRWHKASPSAPTTYTTLDGDPLLLAPGQTWVEVLPPDVGTVE